jgi:hypothetical protein
VIVILDGFDRLFPDPDLRKHVQQVFAGLVEAVYSLSIRADFEGRLVVKALIPHDRFVSMQLRDMDKIRGTHKAIRWDMPLLKQFLARRINLLLGARSEDFQMLWTTILPEYVENSTYRLRESSFEYILRHTMWRPRHFQSHLNKIKSKYPGQVIDQNMLKAAVTESCVDTTRDFILEYQVEHPHMEQFIMMFKRRRNILSFNEFGEIVKRALKNYDAPGYWQFDEKIEALYKIGFFGLVQSRPARHQTQAPSRYTPPRKPTVDPYWCNFYYSSVVPQPILPLLENDSLIAIHPMFFEYCLQEADPDRIVG